MNSLVNLQNVYLHHIGLPNNGSGITLSVLRIDTIHPIISGNKYFKLYPISDDVLLNGYRTIVTKGGAYSNHIAATAHFASYFGLKSVGIIRGERPHKLSHTLIDAMNCGMELIFVAREVYPSEIFQGIAHLFDRPYYVDEGGYGALSANGAKSIMDWLPSDTTHVITAVGTGCTMAGLIKGAMPHQNVLGIAVLKAGGDLLLKITDLLSDEEKVRNYKLLYDYHFGGYAKGAKQLLPQMNAWYKDFGLPTDFVYTAKMMYGVFDLLGQGSFANDSRIVAIHTGGLQGNLSLPSGSLLF